MPKWLSRINVKILGIDIEDKIIIKGCNTAWARAEEANGRTLVRAIWLLPWRMIRDLRERQLHDEGKSCGIQPAYIRVIKRRFKPLLPGPTLCYSKGEK